MSEKNEPNSIELIYSICKEAIQLQLQQRNTLETKANTLIAFAGVIFALLMNARETIFELSTSIQVSIAISIFFLFITIIACTYVAWVRYYRVYPSLKPLFDKYNNFPEKDTQKQLIKNLISDWNSNNVKLEQKAKVLRIAFFSQTMAFIILGSSLFVPLLHNLFK